MSDVKITDTSEKLEEGFPRTGNSSSEGTAAEQTDRLPEGAAVNADGVPTYLGLCGNKLIMAITVTATCGFTLFVRPRAVTRPRLVASATFLADKH